MAECIICFQSPCDCLTEAKKSVAKQSARTPRRSSKLIQGHRKVTRFSTVNQGTRNSAELKSDSASEVIPVVSPESSDSSIPVGVEMPYEEVIRMLAPLLAEEELDPYRDYLPDDYRLTLDERRRRFRDRVRWSTDG